LKTARSPSNRRAGAVIRPNRNGSNSRGGPRIDVMKTRRLHQVVKGTFTIELSNMLGTQKNSPSRSGLRNGLRVW
jgi:hypothetical protein